MPFSRQQEVIESPECAPEATFPARAHLRPGRVVRSNSGREDPPPHVEPDYRSGSGFEVSPLALMEGDDPHAKGYGTVGLG